MNKPIATRAQKSSWERETCCLCNDERHIVVTGQVNCPYCGNEIPLCRKHAAKLFDELLAIRNEDSAAATAKKEAKKKKKLRWNTACDKVIREVLGVGPCE